MNCIKCGRKIPDGELFCIECSLIPSKDAVQVPLAKSTSKTNAKPKPAVEKPVKRSSARQAAPNHAHAEPQPRKRPAKLIASLLIVILIAMGLGAFIFLNWGKLLEQKANLRVREADVTLREADIADLEQQLTEAKNKLDAANLQIENLNTQISTLQGQLSGTQNTVSQTQYDMTSQQQQVQELITENETLAALVKELEQQATALNGKISTLSASNDTNGAKANFMDSYVVFVNNDSSKYYHTYDCTDFTRQSFWAYSRKLAESNGYTACPNCGG